MSFPSGSCTIEGTLNSMEKRSLFLWGAAIIGGIVLITYSSISWQNRIPKSDDATPSASLVVNQTPGSSAAPGAPSPTPTSERFRGPTGLTAPGSCTLKGSIEFLKPDLSANHDAVLTWKNIDSRSRLIVWRVTPQDNLSIGPNLFANLSIPNGSDTVTVRLPERPQSRNYRLSASVTYGQLIGGNVVVKEAPCSGSVDVIVGY